MTLTSVQQRVLIWLVVATAAALLLRFLGPALTPVVLALVFAYLLSPLVHVLRHRGVPLALAATMTVILAMLSGAVLLLLIVPIITTLLPMLQAQWPALLDEFDRVITPWLARWGVTVDTSTIKEMAMKALDGNFQEWGARLLSSVRIGGSWLITLVGFLVLVPVLVFYMLIESKRATAAAWNLVPLSLRPKLAVFLNECDMTLRQYLRGQLFVMGALALFYPIGLMFTGLTLAWPIGIFTGLAVFIPYLGYGTGLVLALLAAAIQFTQWHGMLAVVAVYSMGQVLESFVLTPRLVGERIGLSPLTVIIALLFFGQAFGFVGVLVALPVSAVAVVALHHAMSFYRASSFYRL